MIPIILLLAFVLDVNMVTLVGLVLTAFVTIFTGPITTVVMFILNERKAAVIREEERADRAELARLTQAELADVKVKGGEREERIIAHVADVKAEVQCVKTETVAAREETKVALGVANGTNSKIEALGIALAAGPKEVIVVNDSKHRVPTENKSS